VLQKVYPLLQAGRFAEAESALRRIVAQAPTDAEAHFLLGMCRYQQGEARDALAPMRRAVELAPAAVQFAVNFGYVLGETGELGEAERVLRGVVSCAPRDPVALNALGITLQQAGRLQEALAVFERGIAIAPRDDGLHNNYGRTLRDAGRTEQALAEIRTALSLNPANLMARLNLGNVLRDTGALAEAIAAYEQVAAAAPNLNMALHNLGEALLEAGRADDARQAFGRAMRAAPAVGAHCQRYADTLDRPSGSALGADERDLVASCLARDDIDLTGIAAVAFELVAAEPGIAALIDASGLGPREFAARMTGEKVRAALSAPLFLDLISRTAIPDVRAERLLTAIRRAALDRWNGEFPAEDAVGWLKPLAAVALHCFINEYAFAMEEEERDQVERLADRLGNAREAGPEAGAALALLGCYRPLGHLAWAKEFAGTARDPWLSRLLRRQVIEPAEEARIGATLPAITPVGDATSRAVQAQYEENPYPRWSAVPQLVAAQPMQQKLRGLFPFLGADLPALERPRLLIAGCGTGRHAALAAMLHPDARVLAIDLSRTSLAYAARRAAELGLRNVEFAQADILEMAALEEAFDIVDCAGVLHHLRDPMAGWRVLQSLLAPKGFMRVALYSELGRAAVVAARALIAEEGYAPDPEGIRRCRQHILALPEGHPARAVAASPDFWSLSGCRDLLFHVQEHRFTLPMLGASLDALEMEFLGFEFDTTGARRAYQAEFPRDADARSLVNWAEFEARHPQSFGGMYQFWTRRRPGRAVNVLRNDSQPT
jgi:tetratricopeptide (TPR) repeat protein/SAM-dependent methyltransferase